MNEIKLRHLAIYTLWTRHSWNYEDLSKLFKLSKKRIEEIIDDNFFLDKHMNRAEDF